jgi:fumarylacetoacetate (FAA) hydrolase
MKLVTYINNANQERLGLFINGKVADLSQAASIMDLSLPNSMNEFLQGGNEFMEFARQVEESLLNDSKLLTSKYILTAPVPHPTSCRDAYSFRQHVAAARRNRGSEMIPEFDQFPIFYFTNHNSIIGEGNLNIELDHLQKLDFELELAAVIGKKGKNISSDKADEYIAGYTIMNDFSARVLQMEEMLLNLGPAKGKDFATAIGPWFVTPDELEKYKITTEFGNVYDLKMTAVHNGKKVSEGNAKDMNWTFAEIIERASYGVEIFPGDVIGSGTVGTGCFLELNGTHLREAKERGEEFSPVWLQNGDEIELEITGLGKLTNKVVLSENNVSILSKKKKLKF